MPMMLFQKNEKKTQTGTQNLENNNNLLGSYGEKKFTNISFMFLSVAKRIRVTDNH
jgi:hypothetical protein